MHGAATWGSAVVQHVGPACRRVARPYSYPSLPPYYPPYRQVLIDGVQRGALADVPHVRVDGGTSPAARHEAVARFQRDAGVCAALVGITVGGTALTLTAASVAISLELSLQPYGAQAATLCAQAATLCVQVVIFLELYWTPGALLQAGSSYCLITACLVTQGLPSYSPSLPLTSPLLPPYYALTPPLLPLTAPSSPLTTLVPLPCCRRRTECTALARPRGASRSSTGWAAAPSTSFSGRCCSARRACMHVHMLHVMCACACACRMCMCMSHVPVHVHTCMCACTCTSCGSGWAHMVAGARGWACPWWPRQPRLRHRPRRRCCTLCRRRRHRRRRRSSQGCRGLALLRRGRDGRSGRGAA